MRRIALLLALGGAAAVLACEESRNPGTNNRPPTTTTSACGNKKLDTGETCDRALTGTVAGACPTACNDGVACTRDSLIGSKDACNAACSFEAISACVNGDGCCPMGCTGAMDNDCSTTCGNMRVDASETCDGNCPSGCDDSNACTTDRQFGAASTCSLACGYQVQSACMNGDGCCPEGCDSSTDGDCSTTCGNGMVDAPKETCDGNCPTSCADTDACTRDVKIGSAATCNVSCLHPRITGCSGGDGCCPQGCTNMNDSDCPVRPATCGNGRLDSGETCDDSISGGTARCPTSCSADVPACMPRVYMGSPTTCNVRCVVQEITTCTGGDRCCPSACTPQNDSDCIAPPSGGAVGRACSSPSSCSGLPGPTSSWVCFTDGFPGGYCTVQCTSPSMCGSGATCDRNLNLCIKNCTSGGNECRTPEYFCNTGIDPTGSPFFGCYPGG